MMFELDKNELAWAAGFFDGEGSLSWIENTKKLILSVCQVRLEPLTRFQWAVQIGKVYGPYVKCNTESTQFHKSQYMYLANGHLRVQAVVAMIWSRLSVPKQDQILEVFDKARSHLQLQSIDITPYIARSAYEKRMLSLKKSKLKLTL